MEELRDFRGCLYCIGATSIGMDEAASRKLTYDLPLNIADLLLPRLYRNHQRAIKNLLIPLDVRPDETVFLLIHKFIPSTLTSVELDEAILNALRT